MSLSLNKSASRPKPLPAVLQSVKHDTRALLSARLDALFQTTDDALFEMADDASSVADQNLYFDSMRIVRLQRASVQQKYIAAYSRSWSGVMSGEPTISAPEHNKPTSLPLDMSRDTQQLSRVASDELALSAAAESISSKISTEFSLPITELTRQLGKVCGRDLPSGFNPLGPECLIENFIAAIETLDVHIKVRTLLLKLFDRFVGKELGEVYEQANRVLCAAESSSVSSPSAGAIAHAHSVSEPADPESSEQFAYLQELLVASRATREMRENRRQNEQPDKKTSVRWPPVGDDQSMAPPVSVAKLLAILSGAQNANSNEALHLEESATALDFRQMLIDHAPELVSPNLLGKRELRLEGHSDNIVDLMTLLFERVLADGNLAIPMRVLIARLQVPLLKVAIIDPSFFTQPSHPARQLLNEVSAAGIGWSGDIDLRRDETFNKVESIVKRVVLSFTEDLTLFSNLIAELRHFVKKENKKRNQVEQQVRETEAGKAKALAAKKTVQNLINEKACGLLLPPDVGHFVAATWSKVLVYLFVTQGEETEAWAEALETLDDLLWSAQVLTHENDVALREELLPRLLTQLESGVTLSNLHDSQDDLARLCETIELLHRGDQGNLDAADASGSGSVSLTEQPPIVLVEEEEVPVEEVEFLATPQFAERIAELREGQWIEFRQASGAPSRNKLVTVVQPGDAYVFVNRKGMKACEHSPNALAVALAAGELTLLDESSVCERALAAVIVDLEHSQQDRPPEVWYPA